MTSQTAPESSSGCEVAGAVALRRGRELALHLELVARPLDVAEHADGRRHRRLVGEARQRERERRVRAVLVVDEQALLADVGDVDDLALTELVEHDALLGVGTEADRLTVVQLDQHVGARLPWR